MKPFPQYPTVTISAEPSGSTLPRPPPFLGASPLFPLGTIPPGINHPGDVRPGHYLAGQIPFLFPLIIFFVSVMASLVLPNMTLGIVVWYIDPHANNLSGKLRPYHTLTPVQPVPTTTIATLALLPPQ